MDENLEETVTKSVDTIIDKEIWINLGKDALQLIIIFTVAVIVIRVGKLAIRNIFKVRNHSTLRLSERRENTLSKLLENTITYVVYFIAALTALDNVFGVEVKALLAGAGIIGLAVGFGAQSLVKDIITGFFIIFEDQFSVGDYVKIGQFEGVVEQIGLRTTKIKSYTGEENILPNGSIIEVTNFSVNNSRAIVDVSIAYQGDIERAEKLIREHIEKLPAQYNQIVGVPEVLGIQNILAGEVVLRVVAETLPMEHTGIARILRREIKQVLDENGIESPLPTLVTYARPQ